MRSGPGRRSIILTLALALLLASPFSFTGTADSVDARAGHAAIVARTFETSAPWVGSALASATSLAEITDTMSLLAALGLVPSEAPSPLSWDAIGALRGLELSDAERDALRAFTLQRPFVAAEVARLATVVASSTRDVDAMFAALASGPGLTDAFTRALSRAIMDPGAVDDADVAALEGVDVKVLLNAASALARASEDAKTVFTTAQSADAAWNAAVDPALRDAVTDSDPFAVLSALARDAAPVTTSRGFLDVLSEFAIAGRMPASVSLQASAIPAESQIIIANILAAMTEHSREGSDASARAVFATLAVELPRLTRAAYNMTLERPHLTAAPRDVPGALDAAFGASTSTPSSRTPPLLVDALADLHHVYGDALSPDFVADVRTLESVIGEAHAERLAVLTQALADHSRDVGSAGEEARVLAERARSIVQRDGAISARELETLQLSAASSRAVQELASARAREVADAALAFNDLAPITATSSHGALYDDGLVVILGSEDSTITSGDLPRAPVLLLDLGGADSYRAAVAGVNATAVSVTTGPTVARASILLDLGGDDLYAPPDDWALGAARGTPSLPALALLVDFSGDDAYSPTGKDALGRGVDGFGVLIDVAGDDRYVAQSAPAHARSSSVTASAAGIVIDAQGDDVFTAASGFPALDPGSRSPSTLAAFFDFGGDDRYDVPCPVTDPCFAVPRQGAGPGAGIVLFFENGGADAYPRISDPGAVWPPAFDASGPRVIAVRSALAIPGDSDGDGTPDMIDDDPTRADPLLDDADGDGAPDTIEHAAGTSPRDAAERPFTIPTQLPGDAPEPGSRGLLIDIPGVLAVGLPGRSEYVRAYALTIDLGLGDADHYGDASARDSVTIDLGGNDFYDARNVTTPALGAASAGKLAAIIDLGGRDVYIAQDRALAYADGAGAFALLLDASGDDTYRAMTRSQAYATRGGSAIFLDLSGNDAHIAATQGVLGPSFTDSGGFALFIDGAGDDHYTREMALGSSDLESYQGASAARLNAPTDHATPSVAAFLDFDGVDVYTILGTDVSGVKNDHVRARPVEDAGGAIALFIDATARGTDSDDDGTNDGIEAVAGTRSRDASSAPDEDGFVLRLPRLGLAVGSEARTRYTEQDDHALIIDLGGDDEYRNHVGSSVGAHSVSLAVDVDGDDVYASPRSVNLSHILATRGLLGSAPFDDLEFIATQGAGILGVGVLRDSGGTNTFDARLTRDRTCAPCTSALRVAGIAQGAGVAGVGGLILDETSRGHFSMNVTATGPGTIVLRTHAQGAGVHGVGFLVAEDDSGSDSYTLDASAPAGSDVATTGQGYGGVGVGILLDAGGPNVFRASDRAQGASEGASANTAVPRDTSTAFTLIGSAASTGALLLPGAGDDRLSAETRSQAWAGTNGRAVLIDAAGDDSRVLSPLNGGNALGQSAASPQGLALLADLAGNDRTIAQGLGAGRAQAFADRGIAILIDLAGADLYFARDESQAHVAPGDDVGANLAVLLDRRGNDVYTLAGRGQGSITQAPSSAGSALFIDLGGDDSYRAAPPGRRPLDTSGIENARAWIVDGDVETPTLVGLGFDYPTLDASSDLARELGLARAHVAVESLSGGDAPDPIEGTVRLRAGLDTDTPEHEIDRVEFYVDDVLLGEGRRDESSYVIEWDTSTRENNAPLVPDDPHNIGVMVFPRAEAGAASWEIEPWRASVTRLVDNPPFTVPAQHDDWVSSADAVAIMIDAPQDAPTGTPCGSCATSGLAPFASEWRVAFTPSPIEPAPVASCADAGCRVTAIAAATEDTVYLEWTRPSALPDIVGYNIVRVDASGATESAGFVDARAARRALSTFMGATTLYRVDVVARDGGALKTFRGETVAWDHLNAIAPVSGARAQGAEGVIGVTWGTVPDAQYYFVDRSAPDGTTVTHIVNAPPFIDADVEPATTYAYTIVARRDDGRYSAFPSASVLAHATPGHSATLAIAGEGSTYALLDRAYVPGAATYEARWDAAALRPRDGEYLVTLTLTDSRGRTAGADVSRMHVDGTAPRTEVGIDAWASAAYFNTSTLTIPVTARDAGSGLRETVFMSRERDAAWGAPQRIMWNASTAPGGVGVGAFTVNGVPDGAELEFVVASRDNVGNVEGASARPWRVETNTAMDGVLEKIADARTLSVRVDRLSPRITADVFTRIIQPGAAIDLTVGVTEHGSGIDTVTAFIGDAEYALERVEDDDWGGRFALAKDGVFSLVVRAVDAAGNVASASIGTVIVDGEAPSLANASAIFPGGRRTGVPGESLTLRVEASDALTPARDLVVDADVQGVSSADSVTLAWSAAEGSYVARNVVVDRLAGVAESLITFRARDLAGNARTLDARVGVNGSPITMTTPVIAERGPVHVVINWTTAEDARSRIDYGEGFELESRTPTSASSRAHSIRVANLSPETEYRARAASISESGVESNSVFFTFKTGPALRVDLADVPRYANASTDVRATAYVSDHRGAKTTALLQARLLGPRGPPRVVAEGTGPNVSLPLNLAQVRDGAYELVVTASSPIGSGESARFPLVVDRTAPLVRFDARAPFTSGARVTAVVEERGSGIDFANTSWLVSGESCALEFERDLLTCIVPPIRRQGAVSTVLVVKDVAGNGARVERSIILDGAPPELSHARLVGADDSLTHLRPGAGARVILDIADATLTRAHVDLSILGGIRDAPLTRGVDGAFSARFIVPESMREGDVSVRVTASDAAGAVSMLEVSGIVDATLPNLVSASTVPRSATSTTILVMFDERVRASARGAGITQDASWTSDVFMREHIAEIAGLLPGRETTLVFTIIDEAGNTRVAPVTARTLSDDVSPSAVSTLAARDLGDGHVLVSWNAATDDVGVARYRVLRGIGDSAATEVASSSTVTHRDVVPVGVPVTFFIIPEDHAGNVGGARSVIVSSRALPTFVDAAVDPPAGPPGRFTFSVRVTSLGDPPHVSVVLDGVTIPMMTSSRDCVDACVFSTVAVLSADTLTGAPHSYYFVADSSGLIARYPLEDALSGPVTLGEADAVEVSGVGAAVNIDAPSGSWLIGLLVAVSVLLRKGSERGRTGRRER